jgi:myo-inositol-1(or 4)-monophosphatase
MDRFQRASLQARKIRMMGSAALGMAYIACGRFDGYIEARVSLWDIAAGQLLLETAGGNVELTPVNGYDDAYSIVASNGKIPIHEIL